MIWVAGQVKMTGNSHRRRRIQSLSQYFVPPHRPLAPCHRLQLKMSSIQRQTATALTHDYLGCSTTNSIFLL